MKKFLSEFFLNYYIVYFLYIPIKESLLRLIADLLPTLPWKGRNCQRAWLLSTVTNFRSFSFLHLSQR